MITVLNFDIPTDEKTTDYMTRVKEWADLNSYPITTHVQYVISVLIMNRDKVNHYPPGSFVKAVLENRFNAVALADDDCYKHLKTIYLSYYNVDTPDLIEKYKKQPANL